MVVETPPRVAPGTRWLGGLVVAALPLVVVAVTYLWWRDRLPDPMPTHWGRGGRLDGTTALAGLVTVLAAIAAVGALVALVAVLAVRAARARRWLVTTGAGTGAFGAGTWLMLAVPALDAAETVDVAVPTWHITALPVAMFGWAALAYATCPPPRPYPAATRRPAPDLPRIDLGPGQRAVYSEVSRPAGGAYLVAAFSAVVAVALGLWTTPWAALPLGLVAAGTLLLSTTRVTVDGRGLRAGFGPWGWPWVRVPLREVAAAEVTEVRPKEWGGWGYRIRTDGSRGVILRRGPGVRLALSGDRTFVASTRDPATVAGLVNTLLDRAPR